MTPILASSPTPAEDPKHRPGAPLPPSLNQTACLLDSCVQGVRAGVARQVGWWLSKHTLWKSQTTGRAGALWVGSNRNLVKPYTLGP